MDVFKEYAYYYNSFYGDKDYKGEATEIDLLLRRYSKNRISSIVDYGCGTGRHDIELSKIGYKCSGIDISQDMIKIAEQNSISAGIEIDFNAHDIRTYSTERKYDAVISLFHVISYLNKNDDVISTFKSARNVLEPDGLFIFDVWHGSGVITDKPEVRVKEIEDEKCRMIRIARPQLSEPENRVIVNYEIFIIDKKDSRVETIKEAHSMRYFFRPEMEKYLELCGFALVDNLDCNTLNQTNYSSWTSYYIAKAV